MDTEEIRVLIVDDDADDTYLICETFKEIQETKYHLTISHSPDEAKGIIEENQIDIVLCDYLMGAKSGLDFIEAIRADGFDVPVILLTGMSGRSLDNAALEAGAADFISKVSLAPDNIDRAVRYAIASVERQRLVQTVLQSVNAAVVVIDNEQCPTLWNPTYAALVNTEDGTDSLDCLKAFATKLLNEGRILTIGDHIFEKTVSQLPKEGAVIMLHDVTEHVQALREREHANNRAAHLAMHCPLTGLPNRNAFADRVQMEIDRPGAQSAGFLLHILDLNKFKEVNDVYGHAVGDELLIEVSQRMSACLEEDDYIARLGGDEFVAIERKKLNGPKQSSLAQRIVESVNQPYSIDGIVVHTGVSVGISSYPDHGATAEALLSNADIALYRAKLDPISGVSAFDEEMDKVVRETRYISRELKSAIECDDVDIFFQPQADAITGRIVGFEALARWEHEKLGRVAPSRFIPVAEDNGLIHLIGQSVMTRACRLAAQLPQDCKVAVNISPLQVRRENLAQLVHECLLETGLSASRLELEVTESVLIDDFDRALHVLRAIKNLGVSIAIDDFGTGYSSLSTLIAFPFDKIKIDKSFTQQIEHSAKSRAAIRAIVGLGHNLDLRIVAEGVESKTHVDFLADLGCHEVQGFLVGEPLPFEAIERHAIAGHTYPAMLSNCA